MFALDVTLNPQTQGGANVDKVYSLLGTTMTSSTRRVSATATTTPELLTISHRPVTKGGAPVEDQHLVRLDKLLTDPVKGSVKLSCWMVLSVPRGTTVVTDQEILDMHGRLLAFTRAAGAIDKIKNSEV